MVSAVEPDTLQAWCTRVVEGASLEDKLTPPPPVGWALAAHDDDGGRPRHTGGPDTAPLRPTRAPDIALSDERAGKLPKLGALTDPAARVACLSRFAHHELCAVELFAWAVLRFPDMPEGLARALVVTAAEEQVHCRLYLARLAAHGARFGELPLSDYFWQHVDKMTSPAAFLCAMGLTLEQANLDFTLLYRDAFRAAGDDETARVIQRVHDDEIRHVALAALWLKRLDRSDDVAARASDADDMRDVRAYERHAPFPFSLARAKGRRFDVAARKKAALSDAMIEAVRAAKPYASRGRPSAGGGDGDDGDGGDGS